MPDLKQQIIDNPGEPSRWVPGSAVVDQQEMRKQLDFKGARVALGL